MDGWGTWKPLAIGDKAIVIGTRLVWIVTEVDGMRITLERRDESGKHCEQVYSLQQVTRPA